MLPISKAFVVEVNILVRVEDDLVLEIRDRLNEDFDFYVK
jgi:hypothetical protein